MAAGRVKAEGKGRDSGDKEIEMERRGGGSVCSVCVCVKGAWWWCEVSIFC